mmetsp:Transcript_83537/g.231698  ORF Transcript_83537/g.231698 Transcript_83537/m.231698 type:complete len:105 (+) Transcript_83537:81-395(+)
MGACEFRAPLRAAMAEYVQLDVRLLSGARLLLVTALPSWTGAQVSALVQEALRPRILRSLLAGTVLFDDAMTVQQLGFTSSGTLQALVLEAPNSARLAVTRHRC